MSATKVLLNSGFVVEVLNVGADGWNIGAIMSDPLEESTPYVGQVIYFHNDEVL